MSDPSVQPRLRGRKPKVCPDPSRLGQAPDRNLAREWGVSVATVRRWRKVRRVAAGPIGAPRLSCPDPSRLGEPAHVLCAAWGVSDFPIRRWRREHGVKVKRGGGVP